MLDSYEDKFVGSLISVIIVMVIAWGLDHNDMSKELAKSEEVRAKLEAKLIESKVVKEEPTPGFRFKYNQKVRVKEPSFYSGCVGLIQGTDFKGNYLILAKNCKGLHGYFDESELELVK